MLLLPHFCSLHLIFAAKPLSTSSSLCLSQSASQVSPSTAICFMHFPCPPTHPHNLPPEILWTWDDCKNNSFVGMTASNVSHSPMWCAICHENGNVITDAEWKAICQSAMLIACTHLFPLSCVSQTGAKQTCKKMYFKWYFLLEWAAAL